MMKRILVYPCGTEIGLEINRALKDSIHYEVIGGSCSYDHGRFAFENHIDNLPFIRDTSTREEVAEFDKAIAEYHIDLIYPAMDGVVTVFSKYRDALTPLVIAPDYKTTEITRSKRRTYECFRGLLPVPAMYSAEDVDSGRASFPLFIKPDVGQGSVGTAIVRSKKDLKQILKDDGSQLILEFLPGREFTIDCFTNEKGDLIYCRGRGRRRIKGGISVNAVFEDRPEFREYAEIINRELKQKGGWFYQMREAADGSLKLLEIASRIAGTSAITRCVGVNLPLLTANLFCGIPCDDVIVNNYPIELDRALANTYRIELDYNTVYLDYDDTVVFRGKVNPVVIAFIYQCINDGKKVVLLSRHDGDIDEELEKYRLKGLFDEVIHIKRTDAKAAYIKEKDAIFIDDSYGERKAVYENCGINVFAVNTLECLIKT